VTVSILSFHLHHQLILLRTIISPPGTEPTLSMSSTVPTTQLLLLSLIVMGTIVLNSAKPLTSVSVPQVHNSTITPSHLHS
jgi:hypothetical protein